LQNLITNILLDILRADNNRLALELSRNEADVRRVEDDAEKTTMRFLDYRSHRQALVAKLGGQPLTSTHKNKLAMIADDKTIKRCLQSENVITYWEALTSVLEGKRFFNTIHFASKWSDKVIHQPGGGVSSISLDRLQDTKQDCSYLWRLSVKLHISLDCCLRLVCFTFMRTLNGRKGSITI
jgi:hypothetical protein